jgi:hypothetical protein
MKPTKIPRPSQRVARTQQSLFDALLELTVENGYERTTVEDVLRRADVGRTAFYSHYENKQDLLLSRIDALPWISGSKDGEGVFDASFLFAHVADQRDLIAGLRRTPAFDEALGGLRGSLLATFTHLVQRRSANGEVDHKLHLTAQALPGAVMQLLLWWLEADMPESPSTMASWFSQLADRMVRE